MSEENPVAGRAGPAGHAPLEPGRRTSERSRAPKAQPQQTGSVEGDAVELQHTAGNAATAAKLSPSPGDLVRDVISRPGKPLDPAVVQTVGEAVGADASSVTVHDGPSAGEAAKAVDAQMFASGTHLVAPEGLDVSTAEGMFKAVHEVHHIVNQQAKGPVEGTETADGLRISDPADRHEQEADAVAASAVLRRFGPSGD